MLEKLQKHVCWTVGTQLVVALEPLAHCWNVVSLLFILIDCMIFLSLFLDVERVSIPTVSFLAQLDSGILYLFSIPYISCKLF